MKLKNNIRSVIVELICLLHVLLFVYAALNKVLDFENFQVQLGQSPLLSSFAGWISYAVPAIELLIAIMLLTFRFRYAGLFASFSLMIMFTSYIVIMLNFSPYVPCSCGGILENLSWNQHLVFNIIFTFFALGALFVYRTDVLKESNSRNKYRYFALTSTAVLSTTFVAILFLLSENTTHHQNNFTRRFPKHPTKEKKTIELAYSSYYIAGYDAEHIYLGNRTAPLIVTIFDMNLNKKDQIYIDLPKYNFPYTAPRMYVKPPYFYFTDGTVPCIFSGSIVDWKAQLKVYNKGFFSVFRPINNEKAVIRAIDSKTKQNALGMFSFKDAVTLKLNPNLLQKQVDGVFDTDGMLLYNSQIEKIIYTYFYRNEFLISDSKLASLEIGHTIDTISHAQIKVATIKSKKITTLAKEALTVNKQTATHGQYLFVNAALMGKFEPEIMWSQASIIDVYDILERTYAFSFYIYNVKGRKTDEFIIINDRVVSLNGKFLTIEKLETNYYKPWIK